MIRRVRSATPHPRSSRGCTLYSSAEARDRQAVTLAGMASNLPKRQLRVHRGPFLGSQLEFGPSPPVDFLKQHDVRIVVLNHLP